MSGARSFGVDCHFRRLRSGQVLEDRPGARGATGMGLGEQPSGRRQVGPSAGVRRACARGCVGVTPASPGLGRSGRAPMPIRRRRAATEVGGQQREVRRRVGRCRTLPQGPAVTACAWRCRLPRGLVDLGAGDVDTGDVGSACAPVPPASMCAR